MAVPICGSGCTNQLNVSRYDKYWKKTTCMICFERAMKMAEEHGLGEWWEANFKIEDKPRAFWDKVGAFI